MGIALVAAFIAVGAATVTVAHHNTRIADAVVSVVMQAMQRGYQCHAEGRSLTDCQDEQRKRWKEEESK